MPGHSIILHARGHLRVAWSGDGGCADHYLVIDSAGTLLHREASLDEAKARVERLLDAGACDRASLPRKREPGTPRRPAR